MKRNRNKKASAYFIIGFLLLLIAGGWLGANLYEDHTAGRNATALLAQMEQPMAEKGTEEIRLPDGKVFCGKIELPKFEISLPVYLDWDYPKLKEAPCRYSGSLQGGNLIIAAHNYRHHFGNLSGLSLGDLLYFTDGADHRHSFKVAEISRLDGTAIEEMQAGEWDLTLFTCTKGGKQRVTVRCVRASS